MRVVIDTNIIISAAIKDRVPEKVILWITKQPNISWVISEEILDEYINVIKRPKFHLNEKQISNWLDLIYQSVTIVKPFKKIVFSPDKLDAMFIECALFCNADYIITGDAHFENIEKEFNVKVINIKEFFDTFVNN
ncbi:MAG TPA: putative toxin-antitoxin system toxin component, PIN family [Candidatus Kapabacteria bacterium]|nr:putative toxin-antitoxin system toxin component, PIN family [Candidatus Kapabacteria bacterium]HPO63861.1 putative toxin-antitoxin system toxin component, PIN family [Candidatus Kapabacteria bacterium]